MKVTRKQAKTIHRAVEAWGKEGVIDQAEQQRLLAHIEPQSIDWQRLSRYAFWLACACVLIALATLFNDSALMAMLSLLFNFSGLGRIIAPALIATGLYYWGFRRQRRQAHWQYSTEAILFLGVVFTAISLWQLGERLDTGSGYIAPLFLVGCAIYGIIGWIARSGLVWLFFIISLACWFGAETGYRAGYYWFSMGYPLRFVLFGVVVLGICIASHHWLQQRQLYTVSKAMGLFYLFMALWILSLFGQHTLDGWYGTRQARLFLWALLFAIVAVVCIAISLKTDDGMLRGFGLTFLGINLYTQFFAFFWDGLNKVMFFMILAASLALLGRYAEKIWRLGESPRPDGAGRQD